MFDPNFQRCPDVQRVKSYLQAFCVRALRSQASFARIGVDLLCCQVDPQRASDALQRASDVWWQTLLCQADLVKEVTMQNRKTHNE